MYYKRRTWGPYKSKKDGRWRICVDKPDGTRSTISYPKFLVEQALSRALFEDEEVDHIDRNFDNNEMQNLKVITRKEHRNLDAIRSRPAELLCVNCSDRVTINRVSQYNSNRRLGRAGPFCSNECIGEYGSKIQNERVEKLPVSAEIRIEYYTNKGVL